MVKSLFSASELGAPSIGVRTFIHSPCCRLLKWERKYILLVVPSSEPLKESRNRKLSSGRLQAGCEQACTNLHPKWPTNLLSLSEEETHFWVLIGDGLHDGFLGCICCEESWEEELAERDRRTGGQWVCSDNVNVTESGLKQVGIQPFCVFRSVTLVHFDLFQAKEYNLSTPVCGHSPV